MGYFCTISRFFASKNAEHFSHKVFYFYFLSPATKLPEIKNFSGSWWIFMLCGNTDAIANIYAFFIKMQNLSQKWWLSIYF